MKEVEVRVILRFQLRRGSRQKSQRTLCLDNLSKRQSSDSGSFESFVKCRQVQTNWTFPTPGNHLDSSSLALSRKNAKIYQINLFSRYKWEEDLSCDSRAGLVELRNHIEGWPIWIESPLGLFFSFDFDGSHLPWAAFHFGHLIANLLVKGRRTNHLSRPPSCLEWRISSFGGFSCLAGMWVWHWAWTEWWQRSPKCSPAPLMISHPAGEDIRLLWSLLQCTHVVSPCFAICSARQCQRNWMISAMTLDRGCCTSAAVSLQYCNVAVQHCTMTVMLECNWHVVHGIDISAHTWASLFCPKLLFTQRCANFLCILIVFGPRILWAHLSQMFCTVFSCPQPPQIRSNVTLDADASYSLHKMQQFFLRQCYVHCCSLPKQQYWDVQKKVAKAGLLPDVPRQSAVEVEDNFKVGGSMCQSLLRPDKLIQQDWKAKTKRCCI